MQQELSAQQYEAIELLTTGAKIGCIAKTLNISRETLWRWRQLPAFAAAQQARMQWRRDQMREQVAEIVRLSMIAIERELRNAENSQRHNPITPALSVLRLLDPARMMAEPASTGPVAPM